jgi:hypothetical protein
MTEENLDEYSEYDSDYYLLIPSDTGPYPMVDIDESRYSEWRDLGVFSNPFPLLHDGYVYPVTPCDPIPKNPEFVDYHDQPKMFSLRVIEQVTQLDISGTQWFPATIFHQDKRYDDYIIMHTYNRVECLDKDKSNFEQWDEDTFDIEKIVLNKSKLDSIPLEDRLIFLMAESTMFKLYHKSIVDEIMKHSPKGCKFIKSKDWGIGSAFD